MYLQKSRLAIACSVALLRCGEGDEEPITKEALDKAVNDAVSAAREQARIETDGLKNKNNELLDDYKKTQKALKRFEGIDVDQLLNLQKTVEGDEILKLHSEGKHDEAYKKKFEGEFVQWESEREKLQREAEEAKNEAGANRTQLEDVLLGDGAKFAFAKANGKTTALDDIALLARQEWTLEEGKPVLRDKDGELVKGENGKITLEEWANGLKKTKPHFFPDSETGDISGGDGEGGGKKSIEQQIIDAANAGKHDLVRKLRKERDKRE